MNETGAPHIVSPRPVRLPPDDVIETSVSPFTTPGARAIQLVTLMTAAGIGLLVFAVFAGLAWRVFMALA